MRVCQSWVTRARISDSLRAASRSPSSGVRAASSSAIARSASRMLFLCTSVGWAVSTGEIQACSSVRAISLGADAAPRQPLERALQRAALQVALALVHRAPAQVVPVLGDVGEVREVAEGADHAHRAVAGEAGQQPVEGAAGGGVALQPIGDRELAHPLDQVEGLLAFLLADHVAEDPAEQADVVDQRLVLGRGGVGGGASFRGHGRA